MAKIGWNGTKVAVLLGIVVVVLLIGHHLVIQDALDKNLSAIDSGKTKLIDLYTTESIGQDPPYLERFRLLDLSDRAVEEVQVHVKPVADSEWIDTGLGISSPIEPGEVWFPLANTTPGRVVAVKVTVKLSGVAEPLMAEVHGLRDNVDPDQGPQDTDVTVVVLGTGEPMLHMAVAYNLDLQTARGPFVTTYQD